MPDPNLNDRVDALWTHVVLADLFADPASRTLDNVLAELCRFGQPVLAAHDADVDGVGIRQEWVCSQNWRTREEELISGSGETPLLAALYCLMESVYYTRRKLREQMADIEGFGSGLDL